MKRHQFSFIAGILASSGYVVFTFLAYMLYPLSYSPTTNWLSDLGNPDLNPGGAIFYNIGIILTSLFLMVFFLDLSVWKMEGNKVQLIMLRLTQVFGILGTFCMLMSGIYPISIYNIHSFWSTSLYILLSTGFVFSAAMLRYHQRFPRWLLIVGASTAVMVILTSFIPNAYVLEWITVILFLLYVPLVGIETKRKKSAL